MQPTNFLTGLAALFLTTISPTSAASPPGAPARFVIHFTSADCLNTTLAVVTGGNFLLTGVPVSQSKGAVASFNGTSTNSTLIFEGQTFGGLGAFWNPDDPKATGFSRAIQVVGGFSQFGWGFSGNKLTHLNPIPTDQFFSCLTADNGDIINVLSIGAPFTNGTLPKFCQKTTPIIVPA